MSTAERRAEIVRILVGRRSDTMGHLATELGVTDRTIRSDIAALTVNYPLETRRGNGGYVRISDWYHPYRNTLSGETQALLSRLAATDDKQQARILRQVLSEYGSREHWEQAS